MEENKSTIYLTKKIIDYQLDLLAPRRVRLPFGCEEQD